jgi:hypothetical protein
VGATLLKTRRDEARAEPDLSSQDLRKRSGGSLARRPRVRICKQPGMAVPVMRRT